MKAQEKAVELYNSYASILPDAVEISHSSIKNCAIALCKEVLNCIYVDTIDWQGAVVDEVGAFDYWQEVIKEIEKL